MLDEKVDSSHLRKFVEKDGIAIAANSRIMASFGRKWHFLINDFFSLITI